MFKKGLVLGIIVLFIGAGVIPSTVGIKKKKTTYQPIRSGGYIQDLIDNASDGDTIYIPNGIYYENIVINKSISLVGEDKNTTIIDGSNIGDVICIEAEWVNISGFTIQESGDANYDEGVDISFSHNTILGNIISFNNYGIRIDNNTIYNNIQDNTFSHNQNGIYFYHSSYNNITGNTITYNSGNGIDIQYSCDNNFISNNTILFNGRNGIFILYSGNNNVTSNNVCFNIYKGISVFDSNLNIISKNNVSSNRNEGTGYCKAGIVLFDSNLNIVTRNTISSNNHSGIRLGSDFGCSRNTITDNYIINNYYGIYIDYFAEMNPVYHNNFINNTINAHGENHQNIWYNAKLQEGNYWSDYKEKYPDAKKKIFKGIWDIPYEIEGGDNQDNYPLIKQWSNTRTRTIPRNKAFLTTIPIFQWLLQRFPILKNLMGY